VIGGILRTAVGGLMVGGGLLGCETTPRSTARPMPDLPTATPIGVAARTTVAESAATTPSTLPGVLARSQWTKALPNIRNMNKQSPLKNITIHHDGLANPLRSASTTASKARLDLIRRAHVGQGWSDIGYHFAVDRAGNVWQCRPLEWEGAHVKHHNPGNVGILVMGNFDLERPTDAQLRALCTLVHMLQKSYRISDASVKSHREWAGAATACPGKHLQPKVSSLRSNGFPV
jgi:hypothetical protein